MTEPFASTAGQAGLPKAFSTAFEAASRLRMGSLTISLPDGREFIARGSVPGPDGRVDVRNPGLFMRLAREGELGFAEAYMEGWWDTPDLQAVLDVAMLNSEEMGSFTGGLAARIIEHLRHWMNRNTRIGARRNIAAHYDLGNAFYRRWLDESMTYSSALFRGGQETLETAQRNKYASICDRIAAPDGGRILEIGCGWGGFAEYAARERGLRVTALTISRAQHDFAARRIHEAGLADRVEVVLRDYRDERGLYDGVASIEMFEAVGERWWPAYFRALHDRLNPGARATLQIITVADGMFDRYRRSVDFIQKHIFPGGMLPSPAALKTQTRHAGLDFVDSFEFGQSYSDTLRRWRDRFEDAWADIAPMGFDERFRRMWSFYLASCASCFLSKATDVTQVTVRRPG